LATLTFIATAPASALSQKVPPGWVVSAATNALTLAGGEEFDAETVFVFKNSSAKLITALSVGFDPNSTHSVDYLETDNALRPGALYRLPIGAKEILTSDHVVRILAVIFSDGTAEGTPSTIDDIRSRRLGRTLEIERIRNLLNRPGTGPDSASLARLLRDIGRLPGSFEEALASVESIYVPGANVSSIRTADQTRKGAFLHGVRGVRESAARSIDDLAQLPETTASIREPGRARRFAALKAYYHSLAEKHRAVLSARQAGKQ
jgi:hypothetical protein